MREIGIEPPRRPGPLDTMRNRYSRPRLEPGSRTRSTVGQVAPMLPLEAPPTREQQRAEYDAAQRATTRPRAAPAYQPPSNQFAEAGQYGLEMTGLPSVRRSARAFASGDMQTGVEEGAMGALGVGTLLAGGRGARAPRPMPDAPPMRAPVAEPAGALRPPTRVYRGIVPDESRRSALGDRWWSDNPELASTYAPAGADGAHVVPGLLDESGFLAVEAPPGTMFRSIPVSSLPPEIRRAFPRTTQAVSTHEIAAAAEAQGFRGVTFSGIRDGGYGGNAEPYGGFQTGDDGRVIAVFDDSTVQSPFPTGGALRPPPRQLGTASDGSVMPVRPPEPFRQSMVGGSDDLAEAARPGALRPAPDGTPPRPQAPDGGSQRAQPTAARYEFDIGGRRADVRINHEGELDFGFSDGWGEISGTDARRMLREVESAIERDLGRFARDGYTVTPIDPQRRRIFEMMAERRGWRMRDLGRGRFRLEPSDRGPRPTATRASAPVLPLSAPPVLIPETF